MITAILKPIVHYRTMVEWLDWDENVVGDYTTEEISGNIDVDAARPGRRSFSMQMENTSGLFIPNNSLVNMRVKVRVKRGLLTSSGTSWFNKGVYILSDPESIHDKAQKEVSLNGLDKWALFDGTLGGTFTDIYKIELGTSVVTAIKAIAELQGETKFNFDTCDTVTPHEIVKQPGDTMADLMRELADIVSYELFYDVNGYLRFRPIVDPADKPILYDFVDTFAPLHLSSTYNPEWTKVKNYWKVTGFQDTTTGTIYSGIAQDDNPNSPTNTSTPPDGIGIKASVLDDANLTSNDLCTERAEYELKQCLKRIDRSVHRLMPCPFLLEQDCVRFADASNGIVDGKYEIQSINDPFKGQMTVEAWRVI